MDNGGKDLSKSRLARLLLVSYAMRRMSYVVRGLAGAYLIYLMYQLFAESGTSGDRLTPLMIAAGVFMIVAGVYFVISAGYALLNGIYAENDPAELEEADRSENVLPEAEKEADE